MKNILILALLLVFTSCKKEEKKVEVIKEPTAEQKAKYTELKNEAWKLYESKDYLKSAQKYSEAFKVTGNKSNSSDRYNAGCSWALANEIDSSYVQLFRIAEKGNYSNYSHITTDTDLSSLHSDKRWNKLLEIVKKNKEIEEVNFDKPLAAKLDTIYEDDQGLRKQYKVIEKKYGRESEEMKTLWKNIAEKDSVNLIKIKKILDERGWLGKDIIGKKGNWTLFGVIQHSDIETQLKYLPMMRDAVKKGNANARSLALLEDRVALRQGKRQIYGSQIHTDKETNEKYVAPLIDPENVDIRRSEVGLGALSDYVSRWNITWDIEKHKERTIKIESEQKQ
jgi:hypothetical protein